MTSRDHFNCDSCGYEWRTRKDVGEPSVCPHCKSNDIANESAKYRENQEEIRRAEEKREKFELDYYNKNLLKLKENNRFVYILVSTRWTLLIIGIVATLITIGWLLIVLSIIGFFKNNSLKSNLKSNKIVPNSEKVARIGINKESRGTYFIDEQGNVAKKLGRSGQQVVAVFGIKKEKGYDYFLDDDGDIARKRLY